MSEALEVTRTSVTRSLSITWPLVHVSMCAIFLPLILAHDCWFTTGLKAHPLAEHQAQITLSINHFIMGCIIFLSW